MQLGRSMVAGVLLAVWLGQSDWARGEVPNIDHASRDNPVGVGTGSGTNSVSSGLFGVPPAVRSERDAPQTTTPLGVPWPPHQLTPAPLLPFHPNRHLMPSPPIPPNAPLSGGDRGRR